MLGKQKAFFYMKVSLLPVGGHLYIYIFYFWTFYSVGVGGYGYELNYMIFYYSQIGGFDHR